MWVAGCPVQPILQLFHCHADAVADAGPQTDNCSEHVEFTLVGAPADAWLTITRRCPLFGWRRLFDARFAVSVRLGGKAEGRAIAGARLGPVRPGGFDIDRHRFGGNSYRCRTSASCVRVAMSGFRRRRQPGGNALARRSI